MREDFLGDKVIRALFAFALGVAFLAIQFASDSPNNILKFLGFVWCAVALGWVVKKVREDWRA